MGIAFTLMLTAMFIGAMNYGKQSGAGADVPARLAGAHRRALLSSQSGRHRDSLRQRASPCSPATMRPFVSRWKTPRRWLVMSLRRLRTIKAPRTRSWYQQMDERCSAFRLPAPDAACVTLDHFEIVTRHLSVCFAPGPTCT